MRERESILERIKRGLCTLLLNKLERVCKSKTKVVQLIKLAGDECCFVWHVELKIFYITRLLWRRLVQFQYYLLEFSGIFLNLQYCNFLYDKRCY